jgi:hypothetical protein
MKAMRSEEGNKAETSVFANFWERTLNIKNNKGHKSSVSKFCFKKLENVSIIFNYLLCI